jgi:hypothetical protein
MFDQILQLVKEQLNAHPQIAAAIPPEQADQIHHEIATHITNGIQNPPAAQTESGGILSQIENSLASGGLATSAITGGLVGSLASKFGLPPMITGAIAAALPGLIKKYENSKNNTPPVNA